MANAMVATNYVMCFLLVSMHFTVLFDPHLKKNFPLIPKIIRPKVLYIFFAWFAAAMVAFWGYLPTSYYCLGR
jgi:hypothetical protein